MSRCIFTKKIRKNTYTNHSYRAWGMGMKENPSRLRAREGFFSKILHTVSCVKDFSEKSFTLKCREDKSFTCAGWLGMRAEFLHKFSCKCRFLLRLFGGRLRPTAITFPYNVSTLDRHTRILCVFASLEANILCSLFCCLMMRNPVGQAQLHQDI